MLLACALCMPSSAKSVVFTLADGTEVYYLLGGTVNPKMRFVDGKVTVNTDKYELSDIQKFYISETDDPNGIESSMADAGVRFDANTLVVKAAQVKTISVSTVGGQRVDAQVSTDGGFVTVDLNGLAKGVYVISTGNSAFKVMVK